MSLVLPVKAAQVLITQGGPRVSETVHSLLDQGATVTLAINAGDTDPSPPLTDDPRVADLLSRGLVSMDAAPDVAAYDVVLRDPRREITSEPEQGTDTKGSVVLLGGGLGSPGLMTLAGLDAIKAADVLVCDRLAPLGLLTQAKPDAEIIHVGKIPRGDFTPQEQINDLLVEHALAGKYVVRLKGGDSFVFGRGGEEWNACIEAGLPVTVIPGVTSSVAAPALAGVPVTHRNLSQGYVVVSGHVTPSDPRCEVDWAGLATLNLTIVILMGVAALDEISATLQQHGMDPHTPAMSVADAGMPSQRSATGTLDTIVAIAAEAKVSAPAVTVIGPVAAALHRQ